MAKKIPFLICAPIGLKFGKVVCWMIIKYFSKINLENLLGKSGMKGVYWESKLRNFRPKDLRSQSRMKFLVCFLYLRIGLMKSIQVLFYLKDMDQKIPPDPTGPDRTKSWSRVKVLLAISWCSNQIINLIFLSFKYLDRNQKL